MVGLKIISTGMYVPKKEVTNQDLSKIVDTSDEWITSRTGMKVRHFVTETDTTTSMAAAAAEEAINSKNILRDDIGVVVVATVSSENYAPSTAALMQQALGLKHDIIAVDVNAGCSGFIFGMETIRGLLMSTGKKYGVLIAAETLSKKMDMTDRSTCVLFGDGAAAVVVELSSENMYYSLTGVDSDEQMINIKVPNGKIHMDGQGTYKFAVATVPTLLDNVIKKAGLNYDDINHYILHQANLRIIDSIATRMKQSMDKFVINIEKYGNTSAVSVGLALAEAEKSGRLKRKDKILLCAFGAGKTYGAIVLEW